MGKWIHRGVALAVFAAYVLVAPGGRYFLCFGPFVWWFMVCFGLLMLLFAEPLDEYLGSTSGASYVPIVRLLGWVFLGAPLVWDLMMWAMYSR